MFQSMNDIGRNEKHEAADRAENRDKNRYNNVLPCKLFTKLECGFGFQVMFFFRFLVIEYTGMGLITQIECEFLIIQPFGVREKKVHVNQ